ncbi:MAG: hypothetical protein M3M96_01605 [Candidatus Eremiobacteraeota bacterium]|nr:hypothetical protein [Candidatus Eremiobacteraeota bacterium]
MMLLALSLAACGGSKNAGAHSPPASPAPLRACETRELSLDGTDMVLAANIDGTLASLTIVHAPDRDAQDKGVEDARKLFGEPHRDTRATTHQSKWGIVEITDACGRPVSPATAVPASSP